MKAQISVCLFSLILSLLSCTAFAQIPLVFQNDPGRFLPEKLVDIEHLSAALKIDPYNQLVEADVEFLFRQTRNDVDSMVLLAPNFAFTEVKLNKNAVDWRLDDNRLIVQLPTYTKNGSTYALFLKYKVKPESELFFIGWNDTSHTMRRQIWAHRPFNWLPYASDRLTMDMFITFDSRYKVFSNGVRESVEQHDDGTSTWHYKMYRSHPFFSTALVVGDYHFKQGLTPKGLPIELWYYPDRTDHFDATYQHMFEMISFCETEFGVPYPYELYRQAPVSNYLYGAMETTTSTIFGDYMHIDERAFWERNYVNVNIHELAHQWFGNYISHLRPKDVWLTESFATYYAKLFERKLYGEEHYQWERQKELERCMQASEKDGNAIASSSGGSDRWYQKGSLVLDMLSDEMGAKNFNRFITHYLKTHAYNEAWTPDLQKAIYETTGQSMDWFFEQWIERGGEPHLTIDMQQTTDSLLITILQTQEVSALRPYFVLSPAIDVYFHDGSIEQFVVKIDSIWSHFAYKIPDGKEISFVIFDPGDRILKQQHFLRPFRMLVNQLQNAQLSIDRYEALCQMDSMLLGVKRDVLTKVFYRNDYHLIQAEILRQLAKDTCESSMGIFRLALTDSNVLVRRAALTHLRDHHFALKTEVEACLHDFSYGNQVLALRKLASLNPNEIPEYLENTKNEFGFPGLQVRVTWLEIAAKNGDSAAFRELVEYAGPRYEFRTRINAIESLRNLDYLDETFVENLIEAGIHWNFKLWPVATSLLKSQLKNDDKKQLIVDKIDMLGGYEKSSLLLRMP